MADELSEVVKVGYFNEGLVNVTGFVMSHTGLTLENAQAQVSTSSTIQPCSGQSLISKKGDQLHMKYYI